MAVHLSDTRSTNTGTSGILSVTRKENFPQWYRTVLKEADLAEDSAVRGCMVIKPMGYGIWEQIQRQMDDMFKREKCCKNAYFPLFIPVSFFEKEATHVAGFAKECAVVTHYRMKIVKEKMVPDPDAKLAEPLIVRPTSETIIGDSMQKWIRSHRDLPMELNQWANVVRWEHETKPFLRTTEFLWQEGHCAYANEKDARANALKMAKVYHRFMTEQCAMPVILGEKSEGERFAGAVQTHCLEAMMQDGRAVQAGTSHYLGQNFAKASEIKFMDTDGKEKFVHTTSWGVSTRLIGALIMVHSDDNGLRVPPRLATYHVVIIPSGKPTSERDAYISKIEQQFLDKRYAGRDVAVHVDERDVNAGEKNWDWVRKGTPIRLEIGPREEKSQTVTLYRRDQDPSAKTVVNADEIVPNVIKVLGAIQQNYYNEAKGFLDSHVRTDITTLDGIKAFFADKNNIGFVRAKWCGKLETEEMLKKDYAVTIRCLPNDQSGTTGKCVLTGETATIDAIFGRSY